VAFSGMIDQLFTDPVLSKPATYLALGTFTPYPVRVISKQPDTVVGFGQSQIHVSTNVFDVRCSDIPEINIGDQITIENKTYIVQSEPTCDRDHLVWTLDTRPA
jgi:hypothetical protein